MVSMRLSLHCPFLVRLHRSFPCTVSIIQPLWVQNTMPKGTELCFEHNIARQTKESLTSQHVSHQPRHVGGKQNQWIQPHWLNCEYMQKLNTTEGNKGEKNIVSLFNYYFPHCTYGYESMLPHLHLLSLVYNNVNPLHEVASNEPKSITAHWGNTEWHLLKMKTGTVLTAYSWGRRAKGRDKKTERWTLFASFLWHWLNQHVLKHTAVKQLAISITMQSFTVEFFCHNHYIW